MELERLLSLGIYCKIPHRLERGTKHSYKGVETSSQQTCFKTVRLTAIHNRPKQTISASGRLELLQMVLEIDTGWCASEDVEFPRVVGWENSHRLERGTKHFL